MNSATHPPIPPLTSNGMDAKDAIDRLIAAVEASESTQVRIARKAGISASKLNKIVKRKQEPSLLEFVAIARALNLDPSRLLADAELAVEVNTLRALHAASQRMHEVLGSLLPEASPASMMPLLLPKPAPRLLVPPVDAAANPNADLIAELEKERRLIPRRAWNRGARRIAHVRGDSMDGGEDPIADGEFAYIRPTKSPRTAKNRIVLIRRGDGLFLKIFEMRGYTIRLVSTNDKKVIEIDARDEEPEIFGYVVDHGPP